MTLLQTPLSGWHRDNGAVMTPVSGWEMPLHYAAGVANEHLHTRSKAGFFDFSHMGKLLLHGAGATQALSCLVTANLGTLQPGRCRYGFFLNDKGGIKDDLIIYRLEQEKYLLVVNPGTRTQDMKDIQATLPASLVCEDISLQTAKFDLQGPLSFSVLEAVLQGAWRRLPYYGSMQTSFDGASLLVSRTGYTGELGVELYCPIEKAEQLWQLIVAHHDVLPVGLGARNTLRLEVGLPFYGADLDEAHTPAEAGFAGLLNSQSSYVGKDHAHTVNEKLTPLVFTGEQCAEAGDVVCNCAGASVGRITSSILSPSLGHGIAFSYIAASEAQCDTYDVQTSGGAVSVRKGSLPFYTKGTARKPLL